MVFFKEDYNTPSEAVKHSDGLTVLAFFYEVSFKVTKSFIVRLNRKA